jgi:sec-independent protein translocase protein TatC
MDRNPQKKDHSEKEMPFISHIRELRRRLIVSISAILMLGVVSFYFYDPIIALLFAPFESLGQKMGNSILYANSLFEGFVIKLQISFISGVICTLPVHLYNLIRFIFPGLRSKEKKIIVISLVSSFLLGAIAIYYGYFQIIPVSIGFLTSHDFIPKNVGLLLNFQSNIFFILQFLLVTIAVFQTPIVLELLMIMRIIKRKALFRASRFVIVGIFILCAVITPGDIVITQLVMAVPMILLYFLTILIAKIFRFGEGDESEYDVAAENVDNAQL